MAGEFRLPDLGEGVAEGEIVKWLVAEGDEIKEDQPMVEVMTDKATVQIPSPTTGKISKILAKEGQTIKVGSTVVIFENTGAPSNKQAPLAAASSPEKTASPVASPAAGSSGKILAAPATRKLARELDVELTTMIGTGPAGRITDDDVRKAAQSKTVAPQLAKAPPPGGVTTTTAQSAKPLLSSTTTTVASNAQAEEQLPLHGIRKRIAEKMARSSRTAASVTHIDEVDFTALIALREQLKPLAEEQKVKLTFLPFIMKAAVAALKESPYFNASIDEEKQQITLKHYYHIGFATDTTNGLIVPVVKDVDKKSILQIAREVEEHSAKAREGQIALENLQGGTFTITNIGTLGGMISTPIINVPEVAILGVHKIQKKPVVRENQIVIRDVAFLALTFDHRIVDGADSARFLGKIIRILENPGLLIVEGTSFQ